jgi:hypothetical protein
MRKYAAILGNLGNTRDRFCSGYKENPGTMEMLQRAAKILDGLHNPPTQDPETRIRFDEVGPGHFLRRRPYPEKEVAAPPRQHIGQRSQI